MYPLRLHPAGEYEDIARDQHPEGIDEKSASAKTQVRVYRDLLGLQPQILVEENRFVQANDDDPGDEQGREDCRAGQRGVQEFGGRFATTVLHPTHPAAPSHVEEVDHREEDDQPESKAVEKPPPFRPEEILRLLKSDNEEKDDNDGPGQSRAVFDSRRPDE